MTKSNKTLLCCLLTCVMVLACALTILPIATPTTANAATGEYTLVTSESDLKAGDKIIIVEKSKAKAAAAMGKQFLTSVDCTFPSENTVQSTDAIEITLGGKSGAWTLTTSEGVIGTTAAKTMVIGKGTTTWTISIAENGTATIASTDTSCGRILYNAGNSPRFLNYTTSTNASMLLPQIYKEATSEPACEHDYGTEIPQVNATCTVDGMKAHYKCSKCNKLFVLEGETYKEVNETTLVIKAAHTWSDTYTITTVATCQANAKGTYTCSVCQATEELEIADTKLDHSYTGANGTCVNGCGYTKDENTVIELYALGTGKTLGKRTLTGVVTVAETDNKLTMVVGSLEDKPVVCYRLTNGSSLKVGDKITVTGTLKDYKGTKEFDSGATYTLIKESLVINEKIAAGEGTTETNGKLYIKKGSKVVLTYSIDANTGINGLGGTFNYNKNFFAINDRANDIVVSNIFGTTVQLTGTETTAESIKFLFVGKDGEENFNGNAVGDFISVTYTVIADITAADLAEMAFGLVDVQAVKEGNVALTDTELVVNNLADYNLAVTNKTTITVDGKESGATIERTYDGTIFSVGTTESDTYKLVSNRTDEPTITWTLGGEPATELKNAGTYTLTIEYAATAEYQAATATYTIVVKQVEIASTNIAITNNTTSKDLLGGNAKWTEADFTITYNGETLPDEFSGLYQIAIVNGEVAEAVAQHTLTVELTLTAQASVNYVLTGTDVAEGKLSKQFVVSVVNAAINIIGMPDNVERAYNAQAIDLSGVSVEDGATLKIYVALNGGAEVKVEENLNTYVKNVGNYVVRFEAHKNANVYSQTRTYTITKCDLAKVELVYNGDTVTWTDTQTNGETVVVKYTIAATEITNHVYTATQKNTEEVKLVVTTDNANYNGYELTLANVYSVTFADGKHETTTQYRFENQLATSITPAAVGGFAFDGWYVTDGETESKFDFTTAVTADVNLTAKWTALTFTVTLMDGETTLNTIDNVAYEALLDKLGITDASKADDEDNYYTFVGWTLTAEGATIDLATTKVTDNMTLYAKFTSASNKFTLTWTLTYNGNAVENGTLTVKRNTALNEIVGLPTSKNANVLTIGTWKNGENDFTAMPTADIAITAAYGIALQAGDVNGDGKVNLDDVVLFRKYLVGGYAIDEIADEDIYTAITAADAASKTMFFKYSANMDNDANLDIRDVATIRMNVVVTTEGGEEQTQTTQSAARMEVVSEAVQYAVLPTNKFVA